MGTRVQVKKDMIPGIDYSDKRFSGEVAGIATEGIIFSYIILLDKPTDIPSGVVKCVSLPGVILEGEDGTDYMTAEIPYQKEELELNRVIQENELIRHFHRVMDLVGGDLKVGIDSLNFRAPVGCYWKTGLTTYSIPIKSFEDGTWNQRILDLFTEGYCVGLGMKSLPELETTVRLCEVYAKLWSK